MIENIPINSDVLKWARKSANLPLDEVALRMKKDVEVIKGWENGESTPTYVQLESLAYEIYKRPIAIFFFPEPPEEIGPNKSFRTLPQSEIEILSPKFLRIFRQAQAIQIKLKELNEGENIAFHKFAKSLNLNPDVPATSMAKKVRDYLKIDIKTQISWKNIDEAFNKWRNLIEGKGIFVFKEAFREDEISGFCLYDSTFPVIYINNSKPRTRQIFTLFHELAHIIFKTGGIDKNNGAFLKRIKGNNKKIEVLCNQFAGEFLLPKAYFVKEIANIQILDKNILDLANKYKVSREVILRKLLDRNLIDQQYYEKKTNQWLEEAKKYTRKSKGGNFPATKASYLGEKYLSLTFKKFYQNKINIDQLADYLGVKIKSIAGIEATLLK